MLALLLVALTLDAQSPPPPPAQELPLKVVVAAPVYQPDGTTSVENVTLADTPGVVHLYSRRAICDTAAAGATEPADAGFGWRLTWQPISVEPERRHAEPALAARVGWRQKIQNGPAGTVQLRLHPGRADSARSHPEPGADGCLPRGGRRTRSETGSHRGGATLQHDAGARGIDRRRRQGVGRGSVARSHHARGHVAGAPSKGATGARRLDRVRLRARDGNDAARRSLGRAHRIVPAIQRAGRTGVPVRRDVAAIRRRSAARRRRRRHRDDLPAARTHGNALTADAGGIAPGRWRPRRRRAWRAAELVSAAAVVVVLVVASAGSGGTVTAAGTQGGTAAVAASSGAGGTARWRRGRPRHDGARRVADGGPARRSHVLAAAQSDADQLSHRGSGLEARGSRRVDSVAADRDDDVDEDGACLRRVEGRVFLVGGSCHG